jgi:uncharacterized protein YggE
MPTVMVRGRGTAPVTPVGVEIVLTVVADDDEPDAALQAVSLLDEQLRGALDELGVPQDTRRTQSASVSARYESDRTEDRRRPVGYRATVSTTVTLTDIGSVGRVMAVATRRAGAEVVGPTWKIAEDDRGYLAACRRAAEDARRRADAYADAFGYRVTGLATASETGPVLFATAGAGRTLGGAAMGGEELTVSPGDQTVSATVDATFELEPVAS